MLPNPPGWIAFHSMPENDRLAWLDRAIVCAEMNVTHLLQALARYQTLGRDTADIHHQLREAEQLHAEQYARHGALLELRHQRGRRANIRCFNAYPVNSAAYNNLQDVVT